MLFYIAQPNGETLEIEVDAKQTAKVILDQALEELGVLESDFFGLQYHATKGELLWLNLRNKICDQLPDKAAHKLRLRVKFFVMPHFIQIDSTRELFYLQVKEAMSQQLISLSEPQCEESMLARLVAYIAHADHGDQTTNSYQSTLYDEILSEIAPDCQQSTSLMERIHNEHQNLRGKTSTSSQYFMLKEASGLPGYGVEHHKVINTQFHDHDINFGVGPEGLVLEDNTTKEKRNIPYTVIKLATQGEKVVHLELLDDYGHVSNESFKLVSKKAAIALYRCITEMNSFYRCDTICSDVQSQYSRDFKGSVFSIFNENSALGKRYLFDIQRTRQEAYDHAKRTLYMQSLSSQSTNSSPSHSLHSEDPSGSGCCMSDDEMEGDDGSSGNANTEHNKKMQSEIRQLKRRLEYYEDSWLCCICKDQRVCVVLIPCGHMTCDTCAKQINQCAMCRMDIEKFQKFYQGPMCNDNVNATKVLKEDES